MEERLLTKLTAYGVVSIPNHQVVSAAVTVGRDADSGDVELYFLAVGGRDPPLTVAPSLTRKSRR